MLNIRKRVFLLNRWKKLPKLSNQKNKFLLLNNLRKQILSHLPKPPKKLNLKRILLRKQKNKSLLFSLPKKCQQNQRKIFSKKNKKMISFQNLPKRNKQRKFHQNQSRKQSRRRIFLQKNNKPFQQWNTKKSLLKKIFLKNKKMTVYFQNLPKKQNQRRQCQSQNQNKHLYLKFNQQRKFSLKKQLLNQNQSKNRFQRSNIKSQNLNLRNKNNLSLRWRQ